ncbi:MAG: hypothetical protein JRF42_00560 [Deltaproteobacteria bacterium]|nr:hypothetical protein [Deltaproteobacteria bacterium]
MFDSDTAVRLDAIGNLGFTNPFGPERPKLEAIIVGEGGAVLAIGPSEIGRSVR